MGANKNLPHVQVLPEDDANRQIATGFRLELEQIHIRKLQVLPAAQGWRNVLDQFRSVHIKALQECEERRIILIIDCDGREERIQTAKNDIPEFLRDRVFILGALNEPEDLRSDLGNFEMIGSKLASDCREETNATWNHANLKHNAEEVSRLREIVRPILFS